MSATSETPSLIKCPDCQQTVSTHALYCPHCGSPIIGPTARQIDTWLHHMSKRLRSVDMLATFLIFIILLAAVIGPILLVLYWLNHLPT